MQGILFLMLWLVVILQRVYNATGPLCILTRAVIVRRLFIMSFSNLEATSRITSCQTSSMFNLNTSVHLPIVVNMNLNQQMSCDIG